MRQRSIDRVIYSPFHQGFLGQGHSASAVIDGNDYAHSDPFMLLMDDQLDLPGGEPVGGAHPHAGFETVTLVLQGDEGHEWQTGSIELMTAGKGIVHTEEITAKTKMRILQLWLVLPPELRWTEPYHQVIRAENIPVLKTASFELRVYSGSSNGLLSPLENLTPLTLVEYKLSAQAELSQEIPADYNGFIYVLDGSVSVGGQFVDAGHSAWFKRWEDDSESEIRFVSKDKPAHFVLYAARPHFARVLHYGPFIGNDEEDIKRLFREYRQGLMPHLNDLPADRKIKHSSLN